MVAFTQDSPHPTSTRWENGYMEWSALSGSSMIWLVAGVVIGAVLIGVVALVASRRRADGEFDDAGDEVDDSVVSVLSMLDEASVVLDSSDEVVQASPSAYRMGVVADDAVSDPQIRAMVSRARRERRVVRSDVTTWTPGRFREDSACDASDAGGSTAAVSRRNWLTVTVSMIAGGTVIVLIDDVSERVRFAQVRDSFIDNVSEQLVGPTAAIEDLAESMESGGIDAAHVMESARQARRYASHLKRMVADLLLLIKAQEPVVPSVENRLSLRDEVDAACDSCAAQAKDNGVRVEVSGEDDLMVNGDPGQIRVAVAKLVENAIAYSAQGTVVSVLVTRASSPERAMVQVVDRGCGIAKDECPRVFERFYRGSNQNHRTSEGIGLGLAIVKHVSLTHHGSVSVWSAPGQGSTFTMSLPVAQ